MEKRYLELLAKEYPTIEAAMTEVINLNAIKCLPKGTEYFFSDLHGEYEAFLFLLKSASGVIRTKIDELFSRTISKEEREFLAELIYEPERSFCKKNAPIENKEDWFEITIYRLIQVCRTCSSKYTRSKVRKKMPPEYAYILDELLHAEEGFDKNHYYQSIIHSIVEIGNSEQFIRAICKLIQDLCIDNLHIIGDIYDRGPRPDIIMNELRSFHDVDIQWGNHDISWMGASCGNLALIANVIRMAIRYYNFDLIEDGYGISLRNLAMFASETYKDDPCKRFIPSVWDHNKYAPVTLSLAAKMHKAIAIIQFKLEGQLIANHPEYEMQDRDLLSSVDFRTGKVKIGDDIYDMEDLYFPTINADKPLELTQQEQELMQIFKNSFRHSKTLHSHMRYLYSHGSMYRCVNGNLLYHGCIPMKKNGEFETVEINGQKVKGKELLDCINDVVNRAYFAKEGTKEKDEAADFLWYLWCGKKSPLFGKSKLASFEQYFIADTKVAREVYNPYFNWSEKEEVCKRILQEFSLSTNYGHIINGHVPVRMKEGESPIKANGKLFIIDGGISKAYRSKTGIAGYTLIYSSSSIKLAKHTVESLSINTEDTVTIHRKAPTVEVIEHMNPRITVAMTDIGKELTRQAHELMELIHAYREGNIQEKRIK